MAPIPSHLGDWSGVELGKFTVVILLGVLLLWLISRDW